MTAAAWRQQRVQLGSGAALLALLAVLLAWTGHEITSYMHSTGLTACLAAHESCDSISKLVENKYGGVLTNVAYLNFVPLLVGLFWGAPLVAREMEQGTYQLAWTQGVTRRRWLAAKLLVFGAAATAIGVSFSLLLTWWYHPYAQVSFHGGFNRMTLDVFDFEGIVPVGYTLFALALGTAAGVLIRRTVPAMALTFAGFLPLRLWLQSVRGHLLTPLRVSYPFSAGAPSIERGAWVVHTDVLTRSGRPFTGDLRAMCPSVGAANKSSLGHCLNALHIHNVDLVQPASRFWAIQGIEFAIFAGLAVALIGLTFWWVTRRIA